MDREATFLTIDRTASSPAAGQRLLFFVNDGDFFLSHRLAIGLVAKKNGYEVAVAAPLSGAESKIRAHGFSFYPIRLDRKGLNPFREYGAWKELTHAIVEFKPDILHCVTIKPVIYGGIAARWTGVPSVVSAISGLGFVFISQGFRAWLRRRVVCFLYRRALKHKNQIVILQNPDDLQVFTSHRLVKENKCVLIKGSGVDPNVFKYEEEKPTGCPEIVLPARMLWDKGVGEFVDAARTLTKEGVSARFLLVGDADSGNPMGIKPSILQGWVNEGIVEWLGYRNDMPSVFAKSNIVCLPSYREGLPKALLDAGACGRALVTTDAPGCREVVTNGVEGICVPVKNAVALADALRELIKDAALRSRMGRAARERILTEFTIEKIVEATLAIYARLQNTR